jgi:hypothetical protein
MRDAAAVGRSGKGGWGARPGAGVDRDRRSRHAWRWRGKAGGENRWPRHDGGSCRRCHRLRDRGAKRADRAVAVRMPLAGGFGRRRGRIGITVAKNARPRQQRRQYGKLLPGRNRRGGRDDSRFAGHWPPDRAERELDGKCQQRQTKAGTGSATGHIGEHPTPRRCGAKQRSAPPAASLSSEFLYADSHNSCVCRKAWLARLFFPDLLSLYAASWPLFSAICLKLVHTRLSLAPIRRLCRRAVPWPSGCSESAR